CLRFPAAGTELLNQIARAKVCLLDPGARAAYDGQLRDSIAAHDEDLQNRKARSVPDALPDVAKKDTIRIDDSAAATLPEFMPSLPAAAPIARATRTKDPG